VPLAPSFVDPREQLLASLDFVGEVGAAFAARRDLRAGAGEELGRFVRSRLFAEDAVVVRGFTGRSSFRTFLFVVAHRLCTEYLEAAAREAFAREAFAREGGREAPSRSPPSAAVERAAVLLRDLPARQRLALRLHLVEQLEVPIVAAALSLAPSLLRRRVVRLRRALRRSMGADSSDSTTLAAVVQAALLPDPTPSKGENETRRPSKPVANHGSRIGGIPWAFRSVLTPRR
jgi:hypothetical protein